MAAIAALWPTEPSIAVWMLAGAAMTIGLTDVIIDTASVTASAFIVSEEDYEKTYARLFFFNRAGSVVLGLDARRRIGGRRGRRTVGIRPLLYVVGALAILGCVLGIARAPREQPQATR